jgi:hypothetical protein
MMCCSTSLPAVIIRSAISSATITMNGRWVGIDARSSSVSGSSRSSVLFAQLVVAADVPHAGAGQQRVALLHLLDRPARIASALRMSVTTGASGAAAAVAAELDHLGVDHQHPHLVRPARHQDRGDDRVQAHALAGSRPAGDQQVGQRRESTTSGLPDTSLPRNSGIRILRTWRSIPPSPRAAGRFAAVRWGPRCRRCSCRGSGRRSARWARAGRSPGRRPVR